MSKICCSGRELNWQRYCESLDASFWSAQEKRNGLGTVELPTRGLGEHRTVLNGFENFPFYVIRQPVNEPAL